MKLLLHTCCGPCFLGVWESLQGQNLEITNYFYNPNIYPEEEYRKRLDNLKIVTYGKTNGIIEAEYRPTEHAEVTEGYENDFPGRCVHCYRLRLEKTAKFAKENDFDAFSTTLLVSPYQQHDVLKQLGAEIAKKFDIEFYYRDFRPYYRAGQEIAKIIPIYRQKYCGCKYSLHPQK